MSRSHNAGTSHNPTLSRAIREEVLQYFQDHSGEVKKTAIYIHFVVEHHEEISVILEEFATEGLIQHKDEGHMTLTEKGKKSLRRLRKLKE